MFCIKVSCIIVFLTNFEAVISWDFLSQIPRQSNNYIKSNFRIQSRATLEVLQSLLPKSSKHRIAEQYQGSVDCGDLDLKSEVNSLGSGKIRQSNTVSIQCEQLS